MYVNEDFPVITTLTMHNKSKIDVAESVQVIEGLYFLIKFNFTLSNEFELK